MACPAPFGSFSRPRVLVFWAERRGRNRRSSPAVVPQVFSRGVAKGITHLSIASGAPKGGGGPKELWYPTGSVCADKPTTMKPVRHGGWHDCVSLTVDCISRARVWRRLAHDGFVAIADYCNTEHFTAWVTSLFVRRMLRVLSQRCNHHPSAETRHRRLRMLAQYVDPRAAWHGP